MNEPEEFKIPATAEEAVAFLDMSWWEEKATDQEVQEAFERSRNSPPSAPFPLDVSTLPADKRETVLKVIALCKADPNRGALSRQLD